jgi:hypothetical protein
MIACLPLHVSYIVSIVNVLSLYVVVLSRLTPPPRGREVPPTTSDAGGWVWLISIHPPTDCGTLPCRAVSSPRIAETPV